MMFLLQQYDLFQSWDFIFSSTGGSIGREGNHDVLLNDIACSKNHCKIEFDEDQDKYFLTDIGSQNGTFIDGHRLSSAKKESPPKEIGHGTIIKIGSTQLICHVHPGKKNQPNFSNRFSLLCI